jgi:hypothetical protein
MIVGNAPTLDGAHKGEGEPRQQKSRRIRGASRDRRFRRSIAMSLGWEDSRGNLFSPSFQGRARAADTTFHRNNGSDSEASCGIAVCHHE